MNDLRKIAVAATIAGNTYNILKKLLWNPITGVAALTALPPLVTYGYMNNSYDMRNALADKKEAQEKETPSSNPYLTKETFDKRIN